MSLLGTLDTLSLPDLFELLAGTAKTGALHVRGERGLGVVYFSGGKVCAGEAGEQSGPVEDRDALLGRLHDVCFQLFRFDEGSFEFEADRRPAWPVEADVDVAALVAETNRRLAEWREITSLVPSIETRPRLVAEPPTATVSLSREQWRVVTGIDGRRRVSALIRVLDGSEYEVCRVLAGLVTARLVEIDPGDAGNRPEAPGADAAATDVEAGRAEGGDRVEEAEGRATRRSRRPAATVDATAEDEPERPAARTEAALINALEEAAEAAARREEERLATPGVGADGLNRGAVAALMSNTRKQ